MYYVSFIVGTRSEFNPIQSSPKECKIKRLQHKDNCLKIDWPSGRTFFRTGHWNRFHSFHFIMDKWVLTKKQEKSQKYLPCTLCTVYISFGIRYSVWDRTKKHGTVDAFDTLTSKISNLESHINSKISLSLFIHAYNVFVFLYLWFLVNHACVFFEQV